MRIRALKVVVGGKWVKGHQDARMAFESLDWWGKMNVKCDNLAKAYLTKITTHFPRPAPYVGWFPGENIRIHIGDHKVTHINKNDLYEKITNPSVVRYWIRQGRFTSEAAPRID